MYWLTLYDNNGIEVKTWRFEKKREQMERYYNLRNKGYRVKDLEKGKYSI